MKSLVSILNFVLCSVASKAYTIFTHGSFETAGVILSSSSGTNDNILAGIEVRGPNDQDFRTSLPFTKYDANNYATSLFHLSPATTFQLRITTDNLTTGLTDVLNSVVTTKTEFVLPSVEDVVTVSNTASLAYAINTAGSTATAAREILLEPGTYGPISITNRNSLAPLIIRAQNPSLPTTIDAGGISNAIYMNNVAHVYLDGLTVTNASNIGVYVRSSHHVVVQNCFLHDNVNYNILVSKNEESFWGDLTTVGHHLIQDNQITNGRHGVQLDNNPGAGTVVRRNNITGGRDNAKICGDEAAARSLPEDAAHVLALTGDDRKWTNHDTEFYDNVLSGASDDNLEAEGICVNVRVYRNTFQDAVNPVAVAPLIPGPAYFLYNLERGRWGQGGVKLNTNGESNNPIRNIYFFHNTLARETEGPLINMWYGYPGEHNVPVKNINFLNNVFWASKGGRLLDESNRGENHPNFAYNCWYTTTASSSIFEWWNGSSRDSYGSFETYQEGTGQSDHGIYGLPGLDNDMNPIKGSKVIDRGVLIPGVNDDFWGSAPDIGAFEYKETTDISSTPTISPTADKLNSNQPTSSSCPYREIAKELKASVDKLRAEMEASRAVAEAAIEASEKAIQAAEKCSE